MLHSWTRMEHLTTRVGIFDDCLANSNPKHSLHSWAVYRRLALWKQIYCPCSLLKKKSIKCFVHFYSSAVGELRSLRGNNEVDWLTSVNAKITELIGSDRTESCFWIPKMQAQSKYDTKNIYDGKLHWQGWNWNLWSPRSQETKSACKGNVQHPEYPNKISKVQ